MTRGLNKVMLIGRLGQEPEMRYTPSGRPLTKLQVAVNRSWKSSDGEKKSETEWFNIVAWGKLAEICIYPKGSRCTSKVGCTPDSGKMMTEIIIHL